MKYRDENVQEECHSKSIGPKKADEGGQNKITNKEINVVKTEKALKKCQNVGHINTVVWLGAGDETNFSGGRGQLECWTSNTYRIYQTLSDSHYLENSNIVSVIYKKVKYQNVIWIGQ